MADKYQTTNDQEQGFLDKIQPPTSQLNPYHAIRKSNQDAVRRRTSRSKARSAQHERNNLEETSPNIDSAQESSECYGWIKSLALEFYDGIKSLALCSQHGSEEGEDSANKGLAELESGEGEELTGYSGDIEAETDEESKEDDCEEEEFGSADDIEECDPEFKELLQTSNSDTENTEQEQEKGSEEDFVVKKKTLLKRIADSSSNDLEQEDGSDGAIDILTNMKGLEEEMRKFDFECESEDESYQLKNEEDDAKLMNEAEKDQHPQKKSLMEWLRGYVELDEDWETVKEIKAEVVKLAAELSHQLVNLMFSLPKIDFVDAMFQLFLNSLKYQCKDENSKVIHRILVLLEFVDEEVKKFEKLKEVDPLEEYSDTDEDDEFHGSEMRKRLIERNQVHQLIPQFLDPILCLENTLLREGEPDQEMLVKDILSLLKVDLKECEKEVEIIASRVDELKAEYGCILGQEPRNICEGIKLKINELWNQGLESEVDEDLLFNF